MRTLTLVALLSATALPALAGGPAPTVPNRTGVGPFVSPSIDIRAAHTALQPAGPAGLWIGNPTLMSDTQAQVPTFSVLPPCFPNSAPCNFETFTSPQGGDQIGGE
jgi:hypothetical protein